MGNKHSSTQTYNLNQQLYNGYYSTYKHAYNSHFEPGTVAYDYKVALKSYNDLSATDKKGVEKCLNLATKRIGVNREEDTILEGDQVQSATCLENLSLSPVVWLSNMKKFTCGSA
jgi:hypothetical protein